MVLDTARLILRHMNQNDYKSLCKILQDEAVMYAYNGAFSNNEVQEWLDRQLLRYRDFGFGLWAVVLKETNEMIGQCGLSMQPWKGRKVLEIGYLFQKACWHKGYASEAAKACKRYAFEHLKAQEVFSIINDTNAASKKVALRNGMSLIDTWQKRYRGMEMLCCLYSVKNNKYRDVIFMNWEGLPLRGRRIFVYNAFGFCYVALIYAKREDQR